MIPNEFVGNIIGKNGKTIKKIKEASQCKIQISDFDSNFPNERKVTFTGSNAANQTAIFLVTDKIEKDRKSTDLKRQGQEPQQEEGQEPPQGEGQEPQQGEGQETGPEQEHQQEKT